MRKLMTILAALLVAAAASAQTVEGSFVQTKTIKASGRSIVSKGNLSYTAPDQVSMIFTDPEGDYMIIDGPFLRSDLNGTAMDVDTSRNAQMRNLKNTLLNCIAGDVEKVAADNDADLVSKPKNGGRVVTLTAKKAAARGYSRIVLEYRQDGMLTYMLLEEFGGISTEMKISNIRKK
ncbi:MAG: outer membrane lipoprotein carrier protein LolA [Bacteroidales bacterium]|nr:outer membrane lipoprotein carrier protein LolA [Bacteroidales bacterium]